MFFFQDSDKLSAFRWGNLLQEHLSPVLRIRDVFPDLGSRIKKSCRETRCKEVKTNFVHYFPQERVVTFVWLDQYTVPYFVGIWQDHLKICVDSVSLRRRMVCFFREILQRDKMQRSKNKFCSLFPTGTCGYFCLVGPVHGALLCWNLARSFAFPAGHLTALLRIAIANPDPGASIEFGSNPDPEHCILVLILVRATLM
jgi:hypothetical protein